MLNLTGSTFCYGYISGWPESSRTKKQLLWICFVKVVVNPMVALGVVFLLDLEPYWAASVVLLSALPTGIMVFIFAKLHDKRVSLASSGIMLTTILSLFSLAIILPLLQAWVQ